VLAHRWAAVATVDTCRDSLVSPFDLGSHDGKPPGKAEASIATRDGTLDLVWQGDTLARYLPMLGLASPRALVS
jgi:hypothetical protein